MSTYDSYEPVEAPRRHRSHRHREHRDHRDRDYDEPTYFETRETYVRNPEPVVPDAYASRTTEIIRRPHREDSDLSIEEVRRDFPPPAGSSGIYAPERDMAYRDDHYGPPVRSRSADRAAAYGAYLGDPRRGPYEDDRRSRSARRKVVKEEIVSPPRRSLSTNQKILAGVAGAALAVGGKELFDRKGDFKHAPEKRNLLGTAAIGAAGAFAAYEGAEFANKKFGRGKDGTVREKTVIAYEGRDGKVAEYYSSGDETFKKPKSSRRKSIVDGALALAGIGAATKAVSSHHDRSRGYDDSDSYDGRRGSSRRSDRSRRGSGGDDGIKKFQQAAKAALLAGATEAFRVRNEPGDWAGAKGKRILTAAIGASAIDAAADRNPDHKSKRHILEAVLGGLAGNRLVNGSRKEIEIDDDGRSVRGSRSRSRSRGPSGGGKGAGLAALATAGLGALAGKKLLDHSRSRSRGGDDRRRRYSSDEDDRRSHDGRPKRSKSVTDIARKGLAALGIGEVASHDRRDDRDRDVVEETHITRKSRRHRDRDLEDDYDRGSRHSGRGSPDDGYGDPRYANSQSGSGAAVALSARERDGQRNRRIAEGKESATSSSDSDLGSSSGDEKRAKKMRGKQVLTAGLAAVATIHAAHNVYQSVEKRNARHKAVKEGAMSPEEAHKLKMKARLQDAASVGIAALGIKGAVSVSVVCNGFGMELSLTTSRNGRK
jgi:hypothetical protein